MNKLYSPLVDLTKRRLVPARERQGINTVFWQCVWGSALLLIVIASVAFWVGSAIQPLVYSYSNGYNVQYYSKVFAFLWTLVGTLLSAATLWVFNQLLLITVRQKVSQPGVDIGSVEFWSKLSVRKWLLDPHHGRLKLSVFTVIFAIATGILTSAYTGLITPSNVYVWGHISGSELNMTSPVFWSWFNETGTNVLQKCTTFNTFGRSPTAITLASCPELQDPVPIISAGLGAIEAHYAVNPPTTSVLGAQFDGTTAGVLPIGWNGVGFFNNVDPYSQPNVSYNYTLQQQGVTAAVSCQPLLQSNIEWTRAKPVYVTNTGNAHEQVNKSARAQTFYQTTTLLLPNNMTQSETIVSTNDFVASFSYKPDPNVNIWQFEFAGYGLYTLPQVGFKNMTCSVRPLLTTVNVTYYNNSDFFATNVVDRGSDPSIVPNNIIPAVNEVFALTSLVTGNQVINSIIALQNTPQYSFGNSGNITIDWPTAMELLIQGMLEYEATYLRMILSATLNQTMPLGFNRMYNPVYGTVESWRVGYNGEIAPLATLLPLQAFLLVCAAVIVFTGFKTGVRNVSKFDPTNTTCLIVASAAGGKNGGLAELRGEDAIQVDEKALALKIQYMGLEGLQEVHGQGRDDGVELRSVGKGSRAASTVGLL